MCHSDKEAALTLFMKLDSDSNTLSGSLSERLIYRRKGWTQGLIGHELLLMIISNQIKGN